jgi:hypothetical protein
MRHQRRRSLFPRLDPSHEGWRSNRDQTSICQPPHLVVPGLPEPTLSLGRRFRIPRHPEGGTRDIVVALEVHRDLVTSEMIVLAHLDNLADHLGLVACAITCGFVSGRGDTAGLLFVAPQPSAWSVISNYRHVSAMMAATYVRWDIASRRADAQASSLSVADPPSPGRTRCVHDAPQIPQLAQPTLRSGA